MFDTDRRFGASALRAGLATFEHAMLNVSRQRQHMVCAAVWAASRPALVRRAWDLRTTEDALSAVCESLSAEAICLTQEKVDWWLSAIKLADRLNVVALPILAKSRRASVQRAVHDRLRLLDLAPTGIISTIVVLITQRRRRLRFVGELQQLDSYQ